MQQANPAGRSSGFHEPCLLPVHQWDSVDRYKLHISDTCSRLHTVLPHIPDLSYFFFFFFFVTLKFPCLKNSRKIGVFLNSYSAGIPGIIN